MCTVHIPIKKYVNKELKPPSQMCINFMKYKATLDFIFIIKIDMDEINIGPLIKFSSFLLFYKIRNRKIFLFLKIYQNSIQLGIHKDWIKNKRESFI